MRGLTSLCDAKGGFFPQYMALSHWLRIAKDLMENHHGTMRYHLLLCFNTTCVIDCHSVDTTMPLAATVDMPPVAQPLVARLGGSHPTLLYPGCTNFLASKSDGEDDHKINDPHRFCIMNLIGG
jgi:hypothetical protein